MVTGGKKNALNCEVGKDGKRGWSTNLCGFPCDGAELKICTSTSPENISYTRADPLSPAGCLAMWCPGVVFGRNKQRLRHLQSQGTPLPDRGTYVNGDCAVYCCLATPRLSWILGVCQAGDCLPVELLTRMNCSDR